MLDLEPQMTPDWNAIRLDLLQVDEPMRAALREMRPFFAKSLPGILARYYDKVRHYDPSSGIFKNGTMHEAIRMQLQHWELIAACNFGPDYLASATRFCELNQRAGVAPQWYVGGRQMFIADQLMKAADDEIAIPRFGRAAQAARDRKALMQNAIAKAMMMDTQNIIAAYFGSNRQIRKDAIVEASDRFRTIITSLSTASNELEGTARSLSDSAGNTTRLATVVANASEDASNNVQSVASATEELASSVREISGQVQESNRIAASAVQQADETDARINALSQAANRIGDVVKLITSVAEQTAKATDEIGNQIAGMQTATQEAVGSIKMISSTIGKISEITSAISAAIEQQGAATQEISGNIQRTAAGTTQVAGTVAEVSQGANQTGAASGQLLSSAKQLSHTTASLQAEIDGFLKSIAAAA